MVFLSFSIVLLMLGPVFFKLAQRWPTAFRLFERTVQILMIAVIIFHILPETIKKTPGGLWSLFFVGWLLPYIFEAGRIRLGHSSHHIALVLGLLGLIIHTFLDGVSLSLLGLSSELGESSTAIRFFLTVHRIPESLFICFLVQPRYGLIGTSYILSALALVTLAGFTATDYWMIGLVTKNSAFLYAGQALGTGALFHLLTHKHTECEAKATLCADEDCHHS